MKYIGTIFLAIVILVGAFYLRDTLNAPQELANASSDNSLILYDRANYLGYSEQNSAQAKKHGNTLLFFAATMWCSNCRAIEEEIIKRNSEIPQDLTILKVDYDRDSAMKIKYGVTLQTTLILLDKEGKEIKRWIGTDFDDLIANIK